MDARPVNHQVTRRAPEKCQLRVFGWPNQITALASLQAFCFSGTWRRKTKDGALGFFEGFISKMLFAEPKARPGVCQLRRSCPRRTLCVNSAGVVHRRGVRGDFLGGLGGWFGNDSNRAPQPTINRFG